MDIKNDDSVGSDILDKSLESKCVVDELGQKEDAGASQQCNGIVSFKKTTTSESQPEKRQGSSIAEQKTEKSVSDYNVTKTENVGGANKKCDSVENNTENSVDCVIVSNAQQLKIENETTAVCVDILEQNASTSKAAYAARFANSGIGNNSASCSSSSSSSSNNSNKSNVLDTKVIQISKNLKDTTLVETAAAAAAIACQKPLLEFTLETTSSSSSDYEPYTPSRSSPYEIEPITDLETSILSTVESIEPDLEQDNEQDPDADQDQDPRSKKVRFHPDVKENDGGNRIIPKKKKKMKHIPNSDEPSTSAQCFLSADEEMDLDEEDEIDEDDEFDIEKTISEAQDYLKLHPLTFVRPQDKSTGCMKKGLLEEEDLALLSESSDEEEESYENVPENGVERILGKHIKGDQIEYLLRYADLPGVYWESEEFILEQCPNLLMLYDQNRERRQARLMRHVAKRQNLRQRYTDF
ncbi:probable serine/threonine-protein kinase dyrk2 [Teleopsis dalmanni]|uniref:probable serine/threonine-protein kinase dyrk2 n=1 Tax=Teleopsis dalmanni TaxID=139649 RepID=UPI0018CE790E|nr:probable serine/threonine-protein kinase dyrk2 [Teleopsis dalmanni]XP_037928346.1 probable serine/threonine-protein kinase dyrk2 [Teleopsis dalmanni]XP_037928347.1 probable serine/threonine-protein kinase dyrk2 [Teleopsis dalmanni]XP_037928348.1 probable serine/threonine-protein kinase dyrk2 [Teleopsis dalmanni]XP_037928349.1 probable serine/threonine-protein kinase dyrk2 [Teleopsis dalmanni]